VADHVSAQVDEASQPAAKKQKTKPKVANVSDALVRLGVVMKKEEKFPKASTMFVQLMDNSMTEANSSEFLAVIDAAMERRTWVHAQEKCDTYVKLVTAAVKHRDLFGTPLRWKVELWDFDVLKHGTLYTDDSYGFPSACNAVQYEIETKLTSLNGGAAVGGLGSPKMAPAVPGSEQFNRRKAWETAIMAALTTVAARNKFPWAKVPVAKIIAKAYEMRYTFANAEHKAQVERWQRMVLASK
jgi:hypothetical protein